MHKLVEDLIDAQRTYDYLESTQGKDNPLTLGAKGKLDAARDKVNSEIETVDQAIALDAAARDAAIKAAEEAKKKAGAATSTTSCDPRAPMGAACGNGCGAMAQQAAAFAACFVDKPSEIDPFRAGCGKSCDPEEPKVDAPASASCFESLDVTAPNPIQSRECWAVRCGTAEETADGCCGPDGKTITGAPVFKDLCTQVRCEEGQVASSTHGSCECTTAYDLPGAPRTLLFGPDPRP